MRPGPVWPRISAPGPKAAIAATLRRNMRTTNAVTNATMAPRPFRAHDRTRAQSTLRGAITPTAPPVQAKSLALSLEIVDEDFRAVRFKYLFHELEMERVILIAVLRGLRVEYDIQRDLVRLVNDRPGAARHPSDVEVEDARLFIQVLFRS